MLPLSCGPIDNWGRIITPKIPILSILLFKYIFNLSVRILIRSIYFWIVNNNKSKFCQTSSSYKTFIDFTSKQTWEGNKVFLYGITLTKLLICIKTLLENFIWIIQIPETLNSIESRFNSEKIFSIAFIWPLRLSVTSWINW